MENEIDVYGLGLQRDTFITLMSQRKSGKSVLISNLIHYFLTADESNRCHYCYLFSTTAKLNQTTNHSFSFLDPRAILEPRPEIINPFVQNLIQSQKKTKMKYHILLVFDDIVVTKRYEALEFLATAGRHYSITVILSSQISNNAISPIIRSNVDYIFWRKLGKLALQNNIFPYMSISDFQDYNQLHQFTLENTSDYRFVFYDNSTDSVDQKIKLVRARDLPPDFRYQLADMSHRSSKPKRFVQW